MRPVLFRWRGFELWSYPALLYVGLNAGIVTGNAAAHANGIDAFRVFLATLVLIPAAVMGARLAYVACHWQRYHANPNRIWSREGGLAMYGGLCVALPLSAPVTAGLRINAAAFWDAAVFTMLTGLIVTRVGCFLHGCCAGRTSRSWLGFYLPNAARVWQKRIPTQCLEAGWAAALLVGAIAFRGRMPFPGALFLSAAAAYGAGRAALEPLRETEAGSGGIRTGYWCSLVVVALSVIALAIRWPR